MTYKGIYTYMVPQDLPLYVYICIYRCKKDVHYVRMLRSYEDDVNVGPFLMEGFGLMKSFREIIQNQLLFEGFGIMSSFGDRNKKIADSES